jgi:hypothetical protein
MYITQKHASQIELQQEYRLAHWLNDVFDLPYGIGEDVLTFC